MSFPMNSMSTGGETLDPPVEWEADGQWLSTDKLRNLPIKQKRHEFASA
jgi:hypothetical protein